MDIETVTSMTIDQLRYKYRRYLQQKGCYSVNTINTSTNDAFYLWKKVSAEVFWNSILSKNFEEDYKFAVLLALRKNSKGDPEKLVNGYVFHGRRLREFLLLDSFVSVETIPNVRNTAKKYSIELPRPSVTEVARYLKQWSTLENYHLQENALDKLFFTLCPKNNDISDILVKVSALNEFYSTNIFSVYQVAKHILSVNIDERLKLGDITLISDIQYVTINGEGRNFYSFATKYCSHHNPIDFPIFDRYVEKVLKYFRDKDGFALFSNNDLKDYIKFKSALLKFRDFYGLEAYNLKEIDKYLWQLGKEYFPIRYKKKK